MMTTTPRLHLPYILQSQSQKEVTHNEALDIIDALLQAAVISVSVNTPPRFSGFRRFVHPWHNPYGRLGGACSGFSFLYKWLEPQ